MSPELSNEFALEEHLLAARGEAEIEHWPGPGAPSVEAIEKQISEGSTVLVTGWDTPPLLTVLEDWTLESPLRLIAHSAGTVRHLVPLIAVQRGLRLTQSNKGIAETVAEFVVGMMVGARRQILAAALRMKAGEEPTPSSHAHRLQGSTVGVIGASAVGRNVMKRLQGWDVDLVLYDPYCAPEEAARYHAALVSLNELLTRSDIVTLHAPLLPETTRMLGANELSRMKDGALLVNMARGALIDMDALLRELQNQRISAALDVTDPVEPLPPDSPFFRLDNCTLTPHIAGSTAETRVGQGAETADEVKAFLSGAPMRSEITADRWDQIA